MIELSSSLLHRLCKGTHIILSDMGCIFNLIELISSNSIMLDIGYMIVRCYPWTLITLSSPNMASYTSLISELAIIFTKASSPEYSSIVFSMVVGVKVLLIFYGVNKPDVFCSQDLAAVWMMEPSILASKTSPKSLNLFSCSLRFINTWLSSD